jgi:hypothetical protein
MALRAIREMTVERYMGKGEKLQYRTLQAGI